MADLVGQIQRDIEKRLQELRPLIEEKERLEAVLAALKNGTEVAEITRIAKPTVHTTISQLKRKGILEPEGSGGVKLARGA